MAGDALGQEVARRLQESGSQPLERPPVDADVHGLARLRVVERRLGRVQEHVERRRDRLRREAIARLRLDLRHEGRRNRVARVEDVGLVVEDLLGLGLRVGDDLEVVRVHMARRNVGDAQVLEPGHLDQVVGVVDRDVGDLVRTHARGRVGRQILLRRGRRDDTQRRECQHVRERAVGLVELVGDRAGRVVGGDAGDRLGLAAVVRLRARHVGRDERLAAPVELEHALDGGRDVRGLDRAPVRELQALAQRELVGQAVAGDLREVLRQRRDELATVGALAVLVGQHPEVADPGQLGRLRRVALVRVDVVRGGADHDVDRAALLATAAARGVAATGRSVVVVVVAAAAGREAQDERHGASREQSACRTPFQSRHAFPPPQGESARVGWAEFAADPITTALP